MYIYIFYIAPDINKKDFPLMNVTLTFDTVTMSWQNLSTEMQREARFQNSEYAFPHPLTENDSTKCLTSPGYS